MIRNKRVMLACPVQGGVSPRFAYDLCAVMSAHLPDLTFDLRIVDRGGISFARNELAHILRHSTNDELVFIDADLPFTLDQLVRLCSHSAPIVCGLYAARSLETVWLAKGIRGEEPDASGLVKVGEAPLGFAKITKDALNQIAEAHPERKGLYGSAGQKPVLMQDFFPLGLTGANTPERRLENMLSLYLKLKESGETPETMTFKNMKVFVEHMERLLTTEYPEMNVFRGEDFQFCAMARKAGLDVLLDSKLVLPHEDLVGLPIPTEQVEKMLGEGWRQQDRKAVA